MAAAFGQVGVLSIAFSAAPRSRARANGLPKEWAPLHRRAPFAGGVDAPSLQAGLGDDGAAALGERAQGGEHARLAPGERARRRADRAIFVDLGVLHQQGADSVWPEILRQRAARQPLAFEIPAHLRARGIDGAAGGDAMRTSRAGR